MSVAQFMTIALLDPKDGYYPNRESIGAAGDFITAPEVSQMFGELIGLWAASVWAAMGSPSEVKFIELGPGRGSMMADALRAIKILPQFYNAVPVHLAEPSPACRPRPGGVLCHAQQWEG